MRALYVGANSNDAKLAERTLANATPPISMDMVSTSSAAIHALATQKDRYNWILVVSMPGDDGFDLLKYVRQNQMPVPIIAVTGSGKESPAFQAIKQDVDAYLIKQGDYLDQLPSTLNRLAGHAQRIYAKYPLRVLYVEENPTEALLTQKKISSIAPYLSLDLANYKSDIVGLLSGQAYDVLLLDLHLGWTMALELALCIQKHFEGTIPIVILTNSGSETLVAQALRLGISDYVTKDFMYLDRLPAVLESAYTRKQRLRVANCQARIRTENGIADDIK